MANPSSPAATKSESRSSVGLLLVVLCVVCGTLAAYYGRRCGELERERTQLRQSLDTSEVKEEEAKGELRQYVLGRAPRTGSSTNVPSKSMVTTTNAPPVQAVEQPIRTNAAVAAPAGQPIPVFQNLAEQEAFLTNLNLTLPTAEQATHEDLLKRIATLRQLLDVAGKIRGNPPAELRLAILREAKTIERLMSAERTALLSAIGRELGYDDDANREFVDTLSSIVRMTAFSAESDKPPAPSGGLPGRRLPVRA